MFFIDENNNNLNLADFLSFWSKKYYRYTNVTDNYYYDLVQDIEAKKNADLIVTRIGVWKTNSLSLNKKSENSQLIYSCNCQKKTPYFLTGMWKENMSSAKIVWELLSGRFYKDRNLIADSNFVQKILEDVTDLKFAGPKKNKIRFGDIYSYTYIHFASINIVHYNILDKFVKIALEYIYSEEKQSLPFKKEMRVTNFEEYLEYNNKVNQFSKNNAIERRRMVDKALWSFGHWLKDQKERKEKIVCCKT